MIYQFEETECQRIFSFPSEQISSSLIVSWRYFWDWRKLLLCCIFFRKIIEKYWAAFMAINRKYIRSFILSSEYFLWVFSVSTLSNYTECISFVLRYLIFGFVYYSYLSHWMDFPISVQSVPDLEYSILGNKAHIIYVFL